MKKILIILFLTLFGTIDALEIRPLKENATLTDIFNTNCLQMTQSQQMLKAYIMKGLNSNFDNPNKNLKKAIPLYDKRFLDIKKYFQTKLKDKEAIEAFNKAQKIWNESKEILEKNPTKEGALKLKENFEQMTPLLLRGSKPLANEGLELLTTTGKLCRDPMKITIDYLLRIWGVDIPNYESDVKDIIEDFYKNLDKLTQNSHNTPKTLKLLEKSKMGFKFFEMMYRSKTAKIPSLLSRKADENFKIIREIKKEYKSNLK